MEFCRQNEVVFLLLLCNYSFSLLLFHSVTKTPQLNIDARGLSAVFWFVNSCSTVDVCGRNKEAGFLMVQVLVGG